MSDATALTKTQEGVLLYVLCRMGNSVHHGLVPHSSIVTELKAKKIFRSHIDVKHGENQQDCTYVTNIYRASPVELEQAIAALEKVGMLSAAPAGQNHKGTGYIITTKGIDALLERKTIKPFKRLELCREVAAQYSENSKNSLREAVIQAGKSLGELGETTQRRAVYESTQLPLSDVQDVLLSVLGNGIKTRQVLDALDEKIGRKGRAV